MQRKWKIIFGGTLAVIVLVAVALQAFQGLEAELLEVHPRDIANTFKEEGKVISKVNLPIHALYGGKIIELHVEEGQQVKEGDILAVLSQEELAFQLRQLEGQLRSLQGEEEKTILEPLEPALKNQELLVEQARQDLETAKANLTRIEKLYATGGASKIAYEEALNAVKSAEINLEMQEETLSLLQKTYSPAGGTNEFYRGRKEALQAQIELLQYQLEACTVTAPVEGKVANLTARVGDLPTPGVPIMNIFQEGNYEIEVYLLADDVPGIAAGMEVALILEGSAPETIHSGTVKNIAPTAVETVSALGLAEQRVKVLVEPATSSAGDLFPGYKLDVEFTIDKRENELVVPKTTLFPSGEGDALWVVRNGKAEIQTVKTGFENDREVVIAEGLQEGDLVVLNPQLEGLKEGKKITGINAK
ncbi:MAG TPA: efflux RND transporter periplasmic adaptor subunit [Firmicutes bacterium]|nr:efflux RND transporter periplasmic adaptor subunit [Bacillota bacterium]